MPPVFAAIGAFISGAAAAAGIGGALSLAGLAAGGAYAAGASFGFAVAGALGSIGLGTILSVAGAGLSLLKASAPRNASTLPTTSVTRTRREAIGYRGKVRGRLRVGGQALVVNVQVNTSEFSGQSGNLFVLALGIGDPITAVNDFYVDSKLVSVDGSLVATSDEYAGKVKFDYRLGTDTQTAFSLLVNNFSGVYDSDWRGIGTSMIIAGFLCQSDVYTALLPYGERTTITATVDGCLVPDPRQSGFNPEDKSTWVFSFNPVLHTLDLLLSGPLESGFNIPIDLFDYDDLAIEADVCDLTVSGPESTTRAKWSCSIWQSYEEGPSGCLSDLLSSFDGRLRIGRNGLISVRASRWEEPTVTLTGDEITYMKRARGFYRAETSTVIKSRYLSPDHGFIEQEAVYEHPNSAIYGKTFRPIDFLAAPNFGQCRHLQKIAANRLNAGTVLVIRLNKRGLAVVGEVYININYRSVTGSFEIQGEPKRLYSSEGFLIGFELNCVSMTQEDVDYDEETEGIPPPEVTEFDGPDFTPSPPALAVSVSGNVALLSLSDASSQNIHVVRYREIIDDSPTYGVYSFVYFEQGQFSLEIVLTDGKVYEFDAQAKTVSNYQSDFSPMPPIKRTIQVDPNPPANCSNIAASSPSAGSVDVSFDTPSSANFNVARVYINTVDDAAGAVLAAPDVAGANTSHVVTVADLSAGSYYFYVCSVNGSNVESDRLAASGNPVAVL